MKKNFATKISLIIPNFNGLSLLKKNMHAVIEASKANQIVFVDDGSRDASVAYVKKTFPQVKIIEKLTNSGFASTVNIGVKASSGDVVVLLNTDVKPEKNFLTPLITHFADESVFAVGCLEKSTESGVVIDRGRGIGAFVNGFVIHAKGQIDNSSTFWVSGGSGAFRKSIWTELGGMDELFNPFYWEDIDLSYRAMKRGYKVKFEPKSIVHHVHYDGVIHTLFPQSFIKTIAYRNQFIFIWKNINSMFYIRSHLLNLPKNIIKSIFRKDISFIKGFMAALAIIKILLYKRRLLTLGNKYTDEQIFHQFSKEFNENNQSKALNA